MERFSETQNQEIATNFKTPDHRDVESGSRNGLKFWALSSFLLFAGGSLLLGCKVNDNTKSVRNDNTPRGAATPATGATTVSATGAGVVKVFITSNDKGTFSAYMDLLLSADAEAMPGDNFDSQKGVELIVDPLTVATDGSWQWEGKKMTIKATPDTGGDPYQITLVASDAGPLDVDGVTMQAVEYSDPYGYVQLLFPASQISASGAASRAAMVTGRVRFGNPNPRINAESGNSIAYAFSEPLPLGQFTIPLTQLFN